MKKYAFNIFDIFVISVITALVVFQIYIYKNAPKENGSLFYTVTVNDIDENAAYAFDEGYDVFGENGKLIGTVQSVTISKKSDTFMDSRGNFDTVEYDGVYTVTLVIKSEAVQSKNQISINGEMIAAGRKISFTSNGAMAVGICSDVKFAYYDGGEK